MDLSQCKRSMGLSLLLVGSLALVACGGDSDTPDAGGMIKDGQVSTADTGMPGADGSAADTGNPGQDGGPTADGGGMDGGGRDGGGRDGGGGNCTQGTEGCPCVSPANTCDTDLTCNAWPQARSTDPIIRTCIRTCTDNAGCAASTVGNQTCSLFFLGTGSGGICVASEAAAAGAPCHGSRRPNGTGMTVGCGGPNAMCLTNKVGADDGTCAELCSVTSTAPNHGCTAPNLFCNPGGSGLITTSTQTGMQEGVGACAATRIGIGSVCSQRDSTKSCDTSSTAGQLFCVGVPDVAAGTGFCFEFCDRTGAQANVCHSSDPGAGHYTCVDALGDPMAGVCSAECEEFPDTCSGRGALGAGTVCHGFQFGADPGMPQPPPFSSCLDVQTPTLRETKFKVNGTQIGAIPNSGDDCSGSNGEGFRCPDGTNCISPQAGVNICVRQCSTSTVPPLFPRGGCGLNSPTSTSAICFLGPGATDTNSLCAEP